MLGAFEQAGYTAEDLAVDNEAGGGAAASASSKPQFKIPLEYRLEEDSLVVSIPLDQVTESESHRLRAWSFAISVRRARKNRDICWSRTARQSH